MKILSKHPKYVFGPLLLAVSVLATVLVAALGVRFLAVRRGEREALARIQARNLAQALDQNIAGTLRTIDQALGSVIGELALIQAQGKRDPRDLEPFLTMEGKLLPAPGFIWVTDALGQTIAGNSPLAGVPNWQARDWFLRCQNTPDPGLVVAKPVRGFRSKQWIMSCVRRYNLPNGEFGGVVIMPLAVAHLESLLAGFDLGPSGTLTLRDLDGGFIARHPRPPNGPDSAVGARDGSPQLKHFVASASQEEFHFARSPFDQMPRLYANRRIRGAMMVGAGLAQSDYLAEWYRDRVATLTMMALAVLAIWTAAWFFQRAWTIQAKQAVAMNQMQKLDSLGKLAGGVAHDMNNVLAAIQAVVQTLSMQRPQDEELLHSLSIIQRAANRGRDLVKGLTNFARKEIREPELLDLNVLVRGEMDLLRRTTLQMVALALDLEEPLAPVLGEKGVLGSALMNLCVNALDAMPQGGTLTLRTRSLPKGMVCVEVADSGTGMPREVLDRALEPFFTTKAVGKGTGLGLSSVYATAKAHGGSVSIQSAPGAGTVVQLQLPAATGRTTAQAAPRPPQAQGALNFLLVDDDELILTTVPTLLASFGHTAVTAPGGREALAILDGGAIFDAVILDLNMPVMNGLETLKSIRSRGLDLPVLLATGHLDAATASELEADPRTQALAKPFTMDELVNRLQGIYTASHA